ncbi:hypothetical protein ABC382_00210 [Lysinibacillus sp. 1P01SD]|uniref:hypothetical protein n=1 Tax=Lysinibacillus sp. 1P01SD TaxID=3132285 RepID=UPI0039A329D8
MVNSLPYVLQGCFSLIKNTIKKRYANNINTLKSDDEWYKNVIIESNNQFSFLYNGDFVCSDLEAIVGYIKSKLTLSDMRYIKEKYGELHYYYIALEFVIIPIYQRSYDKALKELEG